MKVRNMQKFSLKNKVRWVLMLLCTSITIPLITPEPIHAAIPGGTLSEQEFESISALMTSVKNYTEHIKAATKSLFTQNTPLAQDLETMRRLRSEICVIHTNIVKTGSPLAQAILGNLKGLVHHLSEAQHTWILTLESKNLLTMGKNRGFMTSRHNDCLRFLLGARLQNSRHSGEGLIGCIEKTGNPELKATAHSIMDNVNFNFHYAKITNTKEIDLALHLIQHKGFTPRFIKQIAWLLS